MGILTKLFSKEVLKIKDSDLGTIRSKSIKGSKVVWVSHRKFLGFEIEILIEGNKNIVSIVQKENLLKALNNETEIKSESTKALEEQYKNTEIEFTSIEELFDVIEISVNDHGFDLTFQEIQGENIFLNVHFKNNKQVGVSTEEY